MTATLPTTLDAEAAAERVITDVIAFSEMLTVHLGLELGLYAALATHGPATAPELADRTGITARYAREWLEQQAVAGLLACEDPTASPDDRRFVLPAGLATALLDPTSDAFVGPIAQAASGAAAVIREVTEAYRTGGGVPFHAYGSEIRHGLGTLNGATYAANMESWIATMPDVRRRLTTADAPRILDLGCGTGASTLALARAFPRAEVRGVDLDESSIADARANAADAGLAHRVTFTVADAADLPADDPVDLVTIFEALHDMGDPIGALSTARSLLHGDGALYLVDERVADAFTPDVEIGERMNYGFSVLHCLPATLAEDPVTAHGTILRQPTVEEWAAAAGFAGGVEVLDIDDPFWRHYRLHPGGDR